MGLFVNVHFDVILLKTFRNKILSTLLVRLRSDVVKEYTLFLEKEMKMAFKIDVKSFIIGLLAGIVVLLAFGATTGKNIEGKYRLSMSASDTHVFYGRIHIGTGKVETWKYLKNSNAVPNRGDDNTILFEPNTKSSTN